MGQGRDNSSHTHLKTTGYLYQSMFALVIAMGKHTCICKNDLLTVTLSFLRCVSPLEAVGVICFYCA